MTSPIDLFKAHFDHIMKRVQHFAIYVRGREFQEVGKTEIEALLDECRINKGKAISYGIENEANAFLAFEFMTRALIEEFKFCLALKDDDPDSAWDHLVDAQNHATSAMKSHAVAGDLDEYIRRLDSLEKSLFPQPIFLSPGYIVKESKCSICGTLYGECDHIKGHPYMGQLCSRIVTEAILREASVVCNPASKHCRLLKFEENGVWRNAFTYRVMKEDTEL